MALPPAVRREARLLRVEERPCRLAFRVDEIQRAKIEAAASAAGVSMTHWLRLTVECAVKAESDAQNAPEKPADRSPAASGFIRAVRMAAEARMSHPSAV